MTFARLLLYPPRLLMRLLRRFRLWASAVEHGFAQAAIIHARPPRKLCLVSHDAHRHGAQLLALELARLFSRSLRLELHIVVLGPGPLLAEFRRHGRVYELTEQDGAEAQDLVKRLASAGVRDAICSSTASGLFLGVLAQAGVRCVALVHELPALIAERRLERHASATSAHAAHVVFASDRVRDSFPVSPLNDAIVMPQGIAGRALPPRSDARAMLERRFGVPGAASVVVNVGYGDLRKGIDLFVLTGLAALQARPDLWFVWVGDIEPDQKPSLDTPLRASPHARQFIFTGFQADPAPFYAAADLFALTSREDPFPSVLLEAQQAGLPAIAFAGAGGFEALLAQGGGVLVPAGDTHAFADTIAQLLDDPERRKAMAAAAASAVRDGFSMRRYAFDLAHLAGVAPPRVSVVVPNFNYARYLPERLRSILNQEEPIYELIVLDDCSTDDSKATTRRTLERSGMDWRVVANAKKSHTVFEQWRRGVALARGEFVWIAEADDLSDARFLSAVLPTFDDPRVVMSYCQSRQINEAGATLDETYLQYTSEIDRDRWARAYVVDGMQEIATALAVKNTVPNVSACVFRRDTLATALEEHADEIDRFRIAGDWMTYIRVLQHGRIAFDPRALNHHRRHEGSVTASALPPAEVLREIEEIQNLVAAEFNPPQQTREIASAYAATLRRQFGLAP